MTQIIYLAFVVLMAFVFFVGILNFLPSGQGLPDAITSAITLVFGYMNLFNFFFPIDQLFLALTVVLGFQMAIFIWHILRWTIALVARWFGT